MLQAAYLFHGVRSALGYIKIVRAAFKSTVGMKHHVVSKGPLEATDSEANSDATSGQGLQKCLQREL